jgi:hypothetical protein
LAVRLGKSFKLLLLTSSSLADLEISITLEPSQPIFMRVRLFACLTRARGFGAFTGCDTNGATLFPPVEGSFSGTVGLFRGHDQENGIPVLVEFRWDKTNPEAPTWQQSFSADNGNTWEVNWYMYFKR